MTTSEWDGFAPPPAYVKAPSSLTGWAVAAVSALAFHGAVAVLGFVVALDRVAVIRALKSGSAGASRLDFTDLWFPLTSLAEAVTYLVAGVCFILWFRRAYRNLSDLGAFGMRFSPGWAVGAWFVPFLNLVRPKQIADEIWRGTEPSMVSTNVSGPTALQPSGIIKIWWGLFLVQSIGSTVVARLGTGAESSIDLLEVEAAVSAGLGLISVAGLVAAVLLVGRVTRRHEERRSRILGEVVRERVRWAVPVLAGGLLLGGIGGAAFAAVSAQSDSNEEPVAALEDPDDEASIELDTSDDAEYAFFDYLDLACSNTENRIGSLKEPETLTELAAYYDQVLASLDDRDQAFARAPVPERLTTTFQSDFVAPAVQSTAEARLALQPIIEAARAGDAARVDELGNAVPETMGQSAAASAYASRLGVRSCAASFSPLPAS